METWLTTGQQPLCLLLNVSKALFKSASIIFPLIKVGQFVKGCTDERLSKNCFVQVSSPAMIFLSVRPAHNLCFKMSFGM